MQVQIGPKSYLCPGPYLTLEKNLQLDTNVCFSFNLPHKRATEFKLSSEKFGFQWYCWDSWCSLLYLKKYGGLPSMSGWSRYEMYQIPCGHMTIIFYNRKSVQEYKFSQIETILTIQSCHYPTSVTVVVNRSVTYNCNNKIQYLWPF